MNVPSSTSVTGIRTTNGDIIIYAGCPNCGRIPATPVHQLQRTKNPQGQYRMLINCRCMCSHTFTFDTLLRVVMFDLGLPMSGAFSGPNS